MVVLDINLPDIDGIKLGKMISTKYPGTNLVYITGYASVLEQKQIQDLNAKAFLEKPFSVDELLHKIENIIPFTKKDEIETENKETSESAYLLIKFEKGADVFSIYRELYFMDNVVYCDATKGEYDVFMIVQANSKDDCKAIFENKIKPKAGIDSVEFLNIEHPTSPEFEAIDNVTKERELSNQVSSYIMVEAEADKRDIISSVLKSYDNVVYCDHTTGKYNLIMLVYGSYFHEIDKFIENEVSNINGILKVKEYPIINMFDM
ncbi:MAG: response regulator [Chloroflexia bacterium]|nr:response regulator [Chloroflexia bacterium]